MVEKEVHKNYKKASENEIKDAESDQIKIVENLELTDRNIFKTGKLEANIKLKDHKDNFTTKPTTRLINPSKPETGKISKKILSRIVYELRIKTMFNQWKNSDSVIKWFLDIPDKENSKFIGFDINNFYPSINEKLLSDAIDWAVERTSVSDQEKEIILKVKKSFLFCDGVAYRKKDKIFDVTMGSYDGAETCELVGLFLLSKLEHLGLNMGLYRDDALIVSNQSPFLIEKMKKEICKIFKDHDLDLSIEANKTVINFLDITLDLSTGQYRPYMKPNNEIKYVSNLSNHPPAVTKNLPKNINNRLSKLSIDEETFNAASPPYQTALNDSGYNFNLKFDPEASRTEEKKKRVRKRKVQYFNPPWSSDVKTNIGGKFLDIVKSTFHEKHPLSKIFNRNTLKVSYSCLPSMKNEISRHNKQILKSNSEAAPPSCNCRNKSECPLPGKCTISNVVYLAEVIREDGGPTNTYTGLTEGPFKTRWQGHKTSFKLEKYKNSTKLSTYIWSLKDKNIPYKIKWSISGRASTYNPNSNKCRLCLLEKFFILYHPEKSSLNQRSELFSKCLHKRKHLLYNT